MTTHSAGAAATCRCGAPTKPLFVTLDGAPVRVCNRQEAPSR